MNPTAAGLTTDKAARRLADHGANRLPGKRAVCCCASRDRSTTC
ncbi:cation-transporting P-type ATPase [Roseivivax sediminis]